MAQKKKKFRSVKSSKAGDRQFKGVNPVEGSILPHKRGKVKEIEIKDIDQSTNQATSSLRIEVVPEAKLKRVKCLIFQARNETIKRITQVVNEEKDIEQKAMLAQKVLDEVETLLQCQYFDEKRTECSTCQTISNIRKNTVALILKVGVIKPKDN